MKKIQFAFLFIAFLFLQSCFSYKQLPQDLHKSTLLVELQPIVIDKFEFNGGAGKLLNKLMSKGIDRQIKTNIVFNKRIADAFKSYPYKYKLVYKEEVGDSIAEKGNTYYLQNGAKIVTHSRDANGHSSTSRKIEVLLETIKNYKTKKLFEHPQGVAGFAKTFVKAANKYKKKRK